jgi:prepilin-type N-terminal cleavage/methylation domain-containing protein
LTFHPTIKSMEHGLSEEPVMTARTQRTRPTAGFTLIEIMVSITILAVGILALGTLMARGARSAGAASSVSYQTTILGAEAARFDAIPFTQLVAGTTCDTVAAPPLPRIRCGTITSINPKLVRVSVVVTPTDNPLLRPDSLVFERSISGDAAPPLNTP